MQLIYFAKCLLFLEFFQGFVQFQTFASTFDGFIEHKIKQKWQTIKTTNFLELNIKSKSNGKIKIFINISKVVIMTK